MYMRYAAVACIGIMTGGAGCVSRGVQGASGDEPLEAVGIGPSMTRAAMAQTFGPELEVWREKATGFTIVRYPLLGVFTFSSMDDAQLDLILGGTLRVELRASFGDEGAKSRVEEFELWCVGGGRLVYVDCGRRRFVAGDARILRKADPHDWAGWDGQEGAR
jgi:hypothetical protein